MSKSGFGKTAMRIFLDSLGALGGFLIGGPGTAITAGKTVDDFLQSPFGDFILNAPGIGSVLKKEPFMGQKNVTRNSIAMLPRIGNTKNVANLLPIRMGNKNIPTSNLLVKPQPTRAFQLGAVSREPVIDVGLVKGKQNERYYLSTENENPNAAFATSGFSKRRNQRGPREKIYKVVI